MVFPILGSGAPADEAFEISNSARFNDADSAYLNQGSSSGDTKKFTFSFWVKRAKLGASQRIFSTGEADGDPSDFIMFDSNDKLFIGIMDSSYVAQHKTNRRFRDPSAWYHIVWVFDSAQANADNRSIIYVNGEDYRSSGAGYANDDQPTQNADAGIGTGEDDYEIGRDNYDSGSAYLGAYLAEFHHMDGQAYGASTFGETNDNGVWIPKKVSGVSYGTNGFYLDFSNGRINELENATLDVTISGSASLGTDTPANLIDEDFSTTGIGVNNGGGVVQFDADFGSGVTKTIKSYGYRAGNSGAISQVVIKGSNDDSTYTTIDTDTSLATTSSGTRWNFQNVTNTTAYRYYRWEITTTTADHPYINQFEAYTTQPTIFNEQDKAGGLGYDASGTGNHFSSHNIYGYSDQTTDTPTNNFATLNPLMAGRGSTLTEGNCKVSGESDNNYDVSTIGSSMKFYFEWLCDEAHSGGNGIKLSVMHEDEIRKNDNYANFATKNVKTYTNSNDGKYQDGNGQNPSGGGSRTRPTAGDIIMVACDGTNSKVWFGVNGTWLDSGDPANGTGGFHGSWSAAMNSGIYFACPIYSGTNGAGQINFGNPSFPIKTGNADDNGYGNFEYDVPAGFYALCTKNLGEHG